MGDFSRNPDARLAAAAARHYVGVQMQQGVPLLDADWNEQDGLHRHGLETLGTWFIGDGVPVGSDGFFIFPVGAANDVGIREGLCLVAGKVARNDASVQYTTQPRFGDTSLVPPLPPLATPGADELSILYLDVWEEEIDAQADPALIDPAVGVETTVRLQRRWAVRQAIEPGADAVLQNPPPGHAFYPLARLGREGGNDQITEDMIEDLRDTQVSVKRRIEVRDTNGDVVVDDARFRQVLQLTRNNTRAFVRYITTEFNSPFSHLSGVEYLGLDDANYIAQTAEVGLGLVNSRSLGNRGALAFLRQLYEAQNRFLLDWNGPVMQYSAQIGGRYAPFQNFLQRLGDRLHDPTVGTLTGLLPALDTEDLEAATDMQDEIARTFGAASQSIPRGTLQIALEAVPGGNLVQGQLARLTYRLTSFTTLADTYTVQILPQNGWNRRLVQQNGSPVPENRVSLGASGEETLLHVDVNVAAGTSDLQLRVTSDANPAEVMVVGNLLTLTEGQPVPGAQAPFHFQFSTVSPGTRDPNSGVLHLNRNQTSNIELRLANDTSGPLTFALAIATEEEEGAWTPSIVGAPSLQVGEFSSAPKTFRVTPGGDALSARLRVTATATVEGNDVQTEFILQMDAS